MTVESTTKKVTHNGNDVATSFSFSFTIYASTNLVVTKTSSAGVETTLSEGATSTTYSVSVSSYPGSGTITYPASGGTPLATGETITIKRVLPITQLTDLENQGGYFPDTQETQFDKLVMIDLQQQEEIDRSLKGPVSFSGTFGELDTPVASRYIRRNADNDGYEHVALSGVSGALSDASPQAASLTAAAAGTSVDISRADHVHLLPTISVAKGGTGATSEADARTNLGLVIGTDVQAYDADTLKADTADVLTAGFAATPYNEGTKTTGTFTPNEANGNFQYAVNGGAHTLAPPTNNCTLVVQYTNNGSAGAITTSGFTKVSGSFTTTNGDDFMCFITKNNGFSLLQIVALQ